MRWIRWINFQWAIKDSPTGRVNFASRDVLDCEKHEEWREVASAEWDPVTWKVRVTLEPQTLYAAAQIVADQWPEISTVAVGEVVAAFHREQGNLDRLLKQIDTLPPSSPEIPYELLESLYDAAEEMARDDSEGCWFWGNRILYDTYRHEANRNFHVGMIEIRNWKKNNEV